MRYLCALICPLGGIVLDPFFGSGSTGVAALQSGLHFIGIEQELEYVTIARARVAHALSERKERLMYD
jgi:DNA modification methylase